MTTLEIVLLIYFILNQVAYFFSALTDKKIFSTIISILNPFILIGVITEEIVYIIKRKRRMKKYEREYKDD